MLDEIVNGGQLITMEHVLRDCEQRWPGFRRRVNAEVARLRLELDKG